MASAAQRGRPRLDRDESRARIVAAASTLIREKGYAALNVGEVMDRAGIGRTLFYRHFDDLGDLLLKTSADSIEELYETQLELGAAREDPAPPSVHEAIGPAVSVYARHGPLLQALVEAAPGDERIARRQDAIRTRFDHLVAGFLRELPRFAGHPDADLAETARALNLLNTAYLLDAFGRRPRVTEEQALRTLAGIWISVLAIDPVAAGA